MENETTNKRATELLVAEIEKIEKELFRITENIELYKKAKIDKEQLLADKKTSLANLQ